MSGFNPTTSLNVRQSTGTVSQCGTVRVNGAKSFQCRTFIPTQEEPSHSKPEVQLVALFSCRAGTLQQAGVSPGRTFGKVSCSSFIHQRWSGALCAGTRMFPRSNSNGWCMPCSCPRPICAPSLTLHCVSSKDTRSTAPGYRSVPGLAHHCKMQTTNFTRLQRRSSLRRVLEEI